MRTLLLALLTLVQVPAEQLRVVPLPLPTVEWAQSVMQGVRLVDLRDDGAYLLGSACPTGPLHAFTAAHVVEKAKGQLVAIPGHGYGFDPDRHHRSHVRVAWVDQKRDLAQLVVMSSDDAFANWSPRGPIPLAGSEVRGVLLLPGQSGDPVMAPSRGILYGANDGWLWMSMVVGPGSSGSCVMDDQNRVFAILTATSTWGSPESGPRASLSTPLQPKD